MVVASPDIRKEIGNWRGAGELTLLRRPYSRELLRGVSLVFAATGDLEVNRKIVADADAEHVLVNVVDDPAHCHFYTPAVLRRGALTFAISSAGGFPGLTGALRETLELWLPEQDDDLLESLYQIRKRVLETDPDGTHRRHALVSLARDFSEKYLAPLEA